MNAIIVKLNLACIVAIASAFFLASGVFFQFGN